MTEQKLCLPISMLMMIACSGTEGGNPSGDIPGNGRDPNPVVEVSTTLTVSPGLGGSLSLESARLIIAANSLQSSTDVIVVFDDLGAIDLANAQERSAQYRVQSDVVFSASRPASLIIPVTEPGTVDAVLYWSTNDGESYTPLPAQIDAGFAITTITEAGRGFIADSPDAPRFDELSKFASLRFGIEGNNGSLLAHARGEFLNVDSSLPRQTLFSECITLARSGTCEAFECPLSDPLEREVHTDGLGVRGTELMLDSVAWSGTSADLQRSQSNTSAFLDRFVIDTEPLIVDTDLSLPVAINDGEDFSGFSETVQLIRESTVTVDLSTWLSNREATLHLDAAANAEPTDWIIWTMHNLDETRATRCVGHPYDQSIVVDSNLGTLIEEDDPSIHINHLRSFVFVTNSGELVRILTHRTTIIN